MLLSITCAVLAAAFWGLNFTAIYPVLKIIGSEKNLQEWVEFEEHFDKRKVEFGKLRTPVCHRVRTRTPLSVNLS